MSKKLLLIFVLSLTLLFSFSLIASAAEWAPNTYYGVGAVVTYSGTTYTCIQAHTSLVGWEPPNVPALWQAGGSQATPTVTKTPTATKTPSGAVTPTITKTPTRTPTPSSGGGAIFYQDVNYVGTATRAIPPGNYTLSQLQSYGFVNDWASSCRTGGYTVIMYADDNFGGTSWVLSSDTAYFTNLSPNANDLVSSVKIQGSGTPVPTPTATRTPTTSSGVKSFYTTNVNDGLDASDRVDFENKFSAMGYSFLGNNTNVSASQLNSLMGRSDIGILYHTGHGNNGLIATAGGSLTVGSVSGINNNTFISATCLTMTDTTWKNKMNANCYNVFGYTDLSYDYPVDNNVVNRFASEIGSGRTYLQAWYTANVAESSLSDRWLGYVREGGSIVEYSARINNVPKSGASLMTINSAKNLKVASNLLTDQSTFAGQFGQIINSEITVKGKRDVSSGFYKGAKFLSKSPAAKDKAVELAKAWLGSNLPNDAVQDSVIAIERTDETGVSEVVAYVVRFSRVIDGMTLKSNNVSDQITVLVNDNSVVASTKVWPELSISRKPGAISQNQILSVSKVISLAADQIAALIKEGAGVNITNVNPCYGSTGNGVVPAYELVADNGVSFIVNAVTGKLIF